MKFVDVLLRPRVTLEPGSDIEKARALHEKAHNICVVANSVVARTISRWYRGNRFLPHGLHAQGTAVGRDRLPRMHTRGQYLAFAEDCERLAEQPEMARHRTVLRKMAEAWRTLARKGDRTGEDPRC